MWRSLLKTFCEAWAAAPQVISCACVLFCDPPPGRIHPRRARPAHLHTGLLLLLGVASASNFQENTSVIAYVPLGKVGSSSIRTLLTEYNRRRGWKKQLCYVSRGNDRQPSLLRAGQRPYGCTDLPDGTAIQAGHGFCELVHHFTGRRCRYFTVLREPASRMVSEWAYFCHGCRENNRFCLTNQSEVRIALEHNQHLLREADGRPQETPMNSCPEMSLIDYAAMRPCTYVCGFGSDMSIVVLDNKTFARRPTLEAALRNLQSPMMTVLFTEELAYGGVDYLWHAVLNRNETEARPTLPHQNKGPSTPAPLASDIDALKRLLALDIHLYWTLHALMGRELSGRTTLGCRHEQRAGAFSAAAGRPHAKGYTSTPHSQKCKIPGRVRGAGQLVYSILSVLPVFSDGAAGVRGSLGFPLRSVEGDRARRSGTFSARTRGKAPERCSTSFPAVNYCSHLNISTCRGLQKKKIIGFELKAAPNARIR